MLIVLCLFWNLQSLDQCWFQSPLYHILAEKITDQVKELYYKVSPMKVVVLKLSDFQLSKGKRCIISLSSYLDLGLSQSLQINHSIWVNMFSSLLIRILFCIPSHFLFFIPSPQILHLTWKRESTTLLPPYVPWHAMKSFYLTHQLQKPQNKTLCQGLC